MKNNIFFKLISIIFIVFGTYLFLLFLYDFYFYKKLYIKVCSFFYCFEFIEFKDYASILATLIGSAFVAYSLFSWVDSFKYNLKKGDIDRFREATHNLMKTINILHGEFTDICVFIDDRISVNVNTKDFNTIVLDYEGTVSNINTLSMNLVHQYHAFIFESRYFTLHGGEFDLDQLKVKRTEFEEILGYMISDLEDNKTLDFRGQITVFEKKYTDFNNDLSEILDKTYEMLLS
ncbi:hypothetical protein APC62_09660 [Acinetobacter pittii]|uniref:hypothetical protein n=1 Tax=Acinetobacter pittii TaxID=48296 RepID=UPI00070FEDD9|nr:hypothetical protein [Acinetobacter pittii]KRI61161.1 hypothetical protein APC62_09660 [Acinetobacter pittii]